MLVSPFALRNNWFSIQNYNLHLYDINECKNSANLRNENMSNFKTPVQTALCGTNIFPSEVE